MFASSIADDCPQEKSAPRAACEGVKPPGPSVVQPLGRFGDKQDQMSKAALNDFIRTYEKVMEDVNSAELWLLASDARARVSAQAKRTLTLGCGLYNDLALWVEGQTGGAGNVVSESSAGVKGARSAKRRWSEVGTLDACCGKMSRVDESRREIAAGRG